MPFQNAFSPLGFSSLWDFSPPSSSIWPAPEIWSDTSCVQSTGRSRTRPGAPSTTTTHAETSRRRHHPRVLTRGHTFNKTSHRATELDFGCEIKHTGTWNFPFLSCKTASCKARGFCIADISLPVTYTLQLVINMERFHIKGGFERKM